MFNCTFDLWILNYLVRNNDNIHIDANLKGGHCVVPAFACSYGCSSALTTVTVHCAVKPPQSAVRVVVP